MGRCGKVYDGADYYNDMDSALEYAKEDEWLEIGKHCPNVVDEDTEEVKKPPRQRWKSLESLNDFLGHHVIESDDDCFFTAKLLSIMRSISGRCSEVTLFRFNAT